MGTVADAARQPTSEGRTHHSPKVARISGSRGFAFAIRSGIAEASYSGDGGGGSFGLGHRDRGDPPSLLFQKEIRMASHSKGWREFWKKLSTMRSRFELTGGLIAAPRTRHETTQRR